MLMLMLMIVIVWWGENTMYREAAGWICSRYMNAALLAFLQLFADADPAAELHQLPQTQIQKAHHEIDFVHLLEPRMYEKPETHVEAKWRYYQTSSSIFVIFTELAPFSSDASITFALKRQW